MAPSLRLDTSTTAYLVDSQGNAVLDSNQQKIPVAFDVVTGKEYQRVCECVTDSDPRKLGAKQKAMNDNGAVHFVSDVPGFTGWWAPVPEPAAAQ